MSKKQSAAKNENRPLSPYEQWMVKSNLQTIESGSMSAEQVLATLKAGGYLRITRAVENNLNARKP